MRRGSVQIDYAGKTMTIGGQTFKEGDFLSIGGTVGEGIRGEIKTAASEIVPVLVEKSLGEGKPEIQNFNKLMEWCSKVTRLQVRTNAERRSKRRTRGVRRDRHRPTRTEHMFFEGNRIDAMREMILADNLADREKALAKLLPYQREDFVGIFKAMKGFPATIRFLDPPLHEFLPHTKDAQKRPRREDGRAGREDPAARERIARVQPDARFPRLPLGIVFPKSPRCNRAPCSKPPPK